MKNILSKPLYLVLAGLIIIATIVTVLFSVKNMNNQTSLKNAGEVATTYQPDIDEYKNLSNSEIKTQASTVSSEQTAAEFAKLIDAKINAIPTLQTVEPYGAEHSDTYKKAVSSQDTLKNSYEELRLYVRGDLTNQYTFLNEVQHMLGMKVSDYLGSTQVVDGTPVREKLIPPYQAAYDKFTKVPVPQRDGELAKNVRNTYMSFITAAQDAAKKLDAKESFSFDFSKEFTSLQGEVNTKKAAVQTTFTTKVDQATK